MSFPLLKTSSRHAVLWSQAAADSTSWFLKRWTGILSSAGWPPSVQCLTSNHQHRKEVLCTNREIFACHSVSCQEIPSVCLQHTNHKPLDVITHKPLSKAPVRLQWMLLQLQRYDLIITYTPGKHMYIADTLTCHGEQRRWQYQREPLWQESCVCLGGYRCPEWGNTQPTQKSNVSW